MLLLPGHLGGYLCLFPAETGVITERSGRRTKVLADSVTRIVSFFVLPESYSPTDCVRSRPARICPTLYQIPPYPMPPISVHLRIKPPVSPQSLLCSSPGCPETEEM